MSKIGFISLGCPKATVDSERILTELKNKGFEFTDSYEDANIVIVNTCGFIDAAKAQSLETISEALEYNDKVIVTGCMGVKESDIQSIPNGVIAITGPGQYEQVVNEVLKIAQAPNKNPFIDLTPERTSLTPRHYAYLKISEGCNNSCSFCIIPDLRSKHISIPIDKLLTEASNLKKSGVKELLIVAQDTVVYGIDSKYKLTTFQGEPIKTNILTLIDKLSHLGFWIRLHYLYPYPLVDKLVEKMSEGKILPYLDIPLQHVNQNILKRMKRPSAKEKILERIQKWRQICPQISIRSSFIVGFPGESNEDFQELLDFLIQAKLDRVGCFIYSNVDGAISQKFEDQIDPYTKQERYDKLMELQQFISSEKLSQKVGQTLNVIIDEIEENRIIARSEFDSPEIDGNVILKIKENINVGDILKAKIYKSSEYDLFGEII